MRLNTGNSMGVQRQLPELPTTELCNAGSWTRANTVEMPVRQAAFALVHAKLTWQQTRAEATQTAHLAAE